MAPRFLKASAAAALLMIATAPGALARELRITIPLPSSLTPVQRLNREGVEAIRRHQLEKAQELFFKAYLYDPSDPFTLNNLGYSAELSGDAEAAEKFYRLAEEQDSGAVISLSSLERIQGKPMTFALQDLSDSSMRLNRMNVEAIELLLHGRSFEAAALLRRALTQAPGNAFTLNNLAVAEEADGDLEGAARDYQAAVNTQATARIVISPEKHWRGRPIAELAEAGLRRVHQQLLREGADRAQATLLAVNGVMSLNANDWAAARQDFEQAYHLDPLSAFSLNNLGYVAERDGDPETAQYYYSSALRAADARDRVGLASSQAVLGQRLSTVDKSTNQVVDSQIQAYSLKRREEGGTPTLTVPNRPGVATPAPPTH